MIRVRYFAAYREVIGVAEENYPAVATLQLLQQCIRERHPQAAARVLDDPRCIVAHNHQVVPAAASAAVVIAAGDEMAFFPPVSGG